MHHTADNGWNLCGFLIEQKPLFLAVLFLTSFGSSSHGSKSLTIQMDNRSPSPEGIDLLRDEMRNAMPLSDYSVLYGFLVSAESVVYFH
jgi:hypothetical protein